jgi:hypothetical protein
MVLVHPSPNNSDHFQHHFVLNLRNNTFGIKRRENALGTRLLESHFLLLYIPFSIHPPTIPLTNITAPVFDRLAIPKTTRTTNGTFWDTSPPSIWRARTGAAADSAWESVGSNITPIVISSSDVLSLGKDPALAVKVPVALNYGDDAYIAGMDVFHHLHCLDKLRREISYTHYHEANEGPSPGSEIHEAHINHCIDVLAQALKCAGSVDIVTFNWVEGHRMPQPDFNNNKVCRDFDVLRDWAKENGIDGDEFFRVATEPPVGAVVVEEVRPGKGGE